MSAAKAAPRAAAYIRVSTEEQVEGHSLAAQRREIERYCARSGLTLVAVYADEGVSAHTDRVERRPQLLALLSDAARGDFDVVIVHTLDRWARNIRVQSEALEQLGRAGVGFVSITEHFDFSTPAGRMMLTMMGGVSEFFSDQLAVHVLKGQRERAERGLPVGNPPFGYITTEPGLPPAIVEEEGAAVRAAFAMRAGGASNGAIAVWLNAQGLRTRTGRLFTAHAVKDLLNCRFYMGVVSFREEEFAGRHEPLVDRETFELVQARRSRRGPSVAARGKARGVLSGLIRCARCGSPLHADRNRLGRAMYRERHGRPCPTNQRAFVALPVDEQVAALFGSLELRADWQSAIAGRAVAADGPGVTALLARRQRLARAYADGGFTLAEYEARLAAVEAEIGLAQMDTPVEVAELAALLGDLPALWREALPDERRRLLATLVTSVFVEVESRRVVALAPQPAFKILLQSALGRTADGAVVLLAPGGAPAAGECGVGGDGGELNSPSSEHPPWICYGRSRWEVLPPVLHRRGVGRPASVVLAAGARGARQRSSPAVVASSGPSDGGRGDVATG